MSILKVTSLLGVVFLLSAFTLHQLTSWEIGKNYSIKFSGDRVSGNFTKFKGIIDFDADKLDQAKFDLTIDVKSINTGNSMMDDHAIGEDWFHAEKYPQIKFVSSKFSKTLNGFNVTGNMTIHGITKEITIPFNFNNNNFTSKFEINRTDYQIGSAKGMQGFVGLILKIEVSVPVVKKSI